MLCSRGFSQQIVLPRDHRGAIQNRTIFSIASLLLELVEVPLSGSRYESHIPSFFWFEDKTYQLSIQWDGLSGYSAMGGGNTVNPKQGVKWN
jgi:hypothetical protein